MKPEAIVVKEWNDPRPIGLSEKADPFKKATRKRRGSFQTKPGHFQSESERIYAEAASEPIPSARFHLGPD